MTEGGREGARMRGWEIGSEVAGDLIAGIVGIIHVPELVFIGPANRALEILGKELSLTSCAIKSVRGSSLN
jgi:hypothetical protein